MSDSDSGDSFEILSGPDEENKDLKYASQYPEKFTEIQSKLQEHVSSDEARCLNIFSEGYKEENRIKDGETKKEIYCEVLKHEHISHKCNKYLIKQQGIEYLKRRPALEIDETINKDELKSSAERNIITSNKPSVIQETSNTDIDCIVNSDNASLNLSDNDVNPPVVNKSTVMKVLNEAEEDFYESNTVSTVNDLENSNCTNIHETNLSIPTITQSNSENVEEKNQNFHPSDERNQIKSFDVNLQHKKMEIDKAKTEMCHDLLKNKHLPSQCDKCVTEHQETNETSEKNIIKEWKSNTDQNILVCSKSVTAAEDNGNRAKCNVNSDNTTLTSSGFKDNRSVVNESATEKVLTKTKQEINEENMNSAKTESESSSCNNIHETEIAISVLETNENFNEVYKKVYSSDEKNRIQSFDMNTQQKNIKDSKAKTEEACEVLEDKDRIFYQGDQCFTRHKATEDSEKKLTNETGIQTTDKEWPSSTDRNILASNTSVRVKEDINLGVKYYKSGDDVALGASRDKGNGNVENKNYTENASQSLKVTNTYNSTSIPRIKYGLNERSQKFHPYDKRDSLKFPSEKNEKNKCLLDVKIKPERSRKDLRNKHTFCHCDECLTGQVATKQSKRKLTHEIGVQTIEKGWTSSAHENALVSNNLVVVKETLSRRVECNANSNYASYSSSSVKPNESFRSDETLLKFLGEEEQEFNNEYRRKLHQNPTTEENFTNQLFKDPDIKSLGDSIRYFRLSSHLVNIETSLEYVRRNKRTVKEHQDYFTGVDKEIQKLSFKYHPDKVRNRGGTEEDLAIAQKLQTAINATRSALKILNTAFIDDIGTYHKFEFYTKLSITSLCNEDEMKYRIFEVMCELGVISRIKQENIISEIRKFLTESKNCIHSFIIDNLEKFKIHCDSALRHLEGCTQGFKKLCIELEEVKKECKLEKNDRNMECLLEKLEKDSKRDLRILDLLLKTAKVSLKGKYHFFFTNEDIDPYFVLPLVYYTNVLLMCCAMTRKETIWGNVKSLAKDYFPNPLEFIYPDFNLRGSKSDNWKELDHLKNPYYLTAYYNGDMHYEDLVYKFIYERRRSTGVWHIEDTCNISKKEIKLEFYYCIQQVNEILENKFKIEDYNEAVLTNLSVLDLKKCMTMMKEFHKEQQELSKGMKNFKKKSETVFQKFDQVFEESKELNRKFREKLEQRMSERASNAFPDKL